ncbi:type VI secretion system ATPase TssH [Morganella morganii]|nr:type VI secretion system ATPase TssH [Morganella morganii]
MINVDLSTLVNRLDPVAKHALENAAARSVSGQQPEITTALFLSSLLETPLTDVRVICQRAGIDHSELAGMTAELIPLHQALTQGYPGFSPLLTELLKDSWLVASAEYHHTTLRSGIVLLVLLQMPQRYLPQQACTLLSNINREQLKQQFDEWTAGSAESQSGDFSSQPAGGNTPASDSLLARFTQNMSELARQDKLDPVLCRNNEIDLMIDILCRRRKNNPVVVGEPGVGKSALIEGLTLRIEAGDVPEKLRGCQLHVLDPGAIQAGAAVKGEFEKRFKGLIQEIISSATPIILFIDEAHTLIGAGNQQGGTDVANLLKPVLARGELCTIAATTWSEYKKYFEKDAALARRFQLVQVKEPTAAEAVVIMRGLRTAYESAHQVFIDDDALRASAELSDRYLSGRQLPDKAIDVLDTACARTAINLTSPPKQISSLKTQLHQIGMECDVLEREALLGLVDHTDRLAALHQQSAQLQQSLDQLQTDWQAQQILVRDIIRLREKLLDKAAPSDKPAPEEHAETNDTPTETGEAAEPATTESIREQLQALNAELETRQKLSSLVSPHVGKKQIAEVIAEWTGVPLNRLSQDALAVVTELPAYLEESIKGQDPAIAHLHKHLLTARADLRRPGRPLGAFLLVGPSGVGKTETVLQIAQLMFGGTQYLTTINMSEFQEKHTISRLIGSPPGYIGYGEGGVLTEAIRRKPYSVVLLDEVEKAHPDVLNLFYQAFDKGEVADGEGRVIDCKNVAFFLTSNLGDSTIVAYENRPDELLDALYPELTAFFKPALLARMEVIPFLPLSDETLTRIIRFKLSQLEARLVQRFGAQVTISDSVYKAIIQRANRAENGARILESVIDGHLLPPLSLLLLKHTAAGKTICHITLSATDEEFTAEVDTE